MDLGQARGLLGQHWTAFVGAVYDPTVRATPGGIQSYVWQSIQNDYISRGESLPAGSFQAVNTLLRAAGEQYRAASNLSSALSSLEVNNQDVALTSAHWSNAVDARPLDQQPLGPQFRVTYMTQNIIDGEAVMAHQTWVAGYSLPESVSGLQSAIETAAQLEAADYGNEWGGVAVPVGIQAY